MRGWSRLAWVVLPVILALVGNLATNTVQVGASWWPEATWSAVAVLIGLNVFAERRASRQRHTDGWDLAIAADALKEQLESQWKQVLDYERIQHPGPMDVRWHLVDSAGLIDHWANVTQAEDGLPPLPASGTVAGLAESYCAITSERLVVLGQPGSGKTITAIRCALDLLPFRSAGGPVPLVVSFKSWSPAVSLQDWLVDHLERERPELALIGPTRQSLAAGLVERGLIIPILDGFDELPGAFQPAALRHLNELASWPLILTSRPDEYAAAVEEATVLSSAAVITLLELTIKDLDPYLSLTANGPRLGVWDPVIHALRERPTEPASEQLLGVLTTPLMLYLARVRYSDSNSDADPMELLDVERFPDGTSVERHLVTEFLPAIYRRRTGDSNPWSVTQAHDWLSYMAREMRLMGREVLYRHDIGATTVASARYFMIGMVVALTYSLPAGFLIGRIFGDAIGNLIVLVFASSFALIRSMDHVRPGSPPTDGVNSEVAGDHEPDQRSQFKIWLDDHLQSTPVRVYLIYPILTLVPAVIAWLVIGPRFALGFWIVSYGVQSYWVPWFLVARLWLPLRGRLPWRQRAFLEDACRRGVLRKSGTRYQFRHALLQDHLRLSVAVQYQLAPRADETLDEQGIKPLPSEFNAIRPHLRFTKIRSLVTFAGTTAVVLALGYQVAQLTMENLWWLITAPVAAVLGIVIYLQLLQVLRPFERYRLRVENAGLVAEVALVKWEFAASGPDPDSRLIEWQAIESIEQVRYGNRDLLVLQTCSGIPETRAARRLPWFEPALGDYAIVVCPLNYFADDRDLVARLREAHSQYVRRPSAVVIHGEPASGGCIADLDQGLDAETVAAWAAHAFGGAADARGRIDDVITRLYERHELNGLELRHCPLATSLDALVNHKSDRALFDLHDRQEIDLISTAIDLITQQVPKNTGEPRA